MNFININTQTHKTTYILLNKSNRVDYVQLSKGSYEGYVDDSEDVHDFSYLSTKHQLNSHPL